MSTPRAYLRQAALALRDLPEPAIGEILDRMDQDEADALSRTWQLYARPSQLRPEGCRPIWLRQAGRGEGKTRSAAEECLDTCEDWGPQMHGLLVNKTIGDVRDVMIEGESGLLRCAQRRGYSVNYIANRGVVEHPAGGRLYVVSSEKPEKPRGYQSNYVWGDEIAAWMHAVTVFDNVVFGWRLPVPGGGDPRMTLTTTPKPNAIMRQLLLDKAWSGQVTVSRGRTSDNASNLNRRTMDILRAVYEGTTLGRQEMDGELLPGKGVIFEQDVIHQWRVMSAPDLDRRIVALDPSITAHENSDAAGIVVVGSAWPEEHARFAGDVPLPHAYVLDDRTLETATFGQWARETVLAFLEHDCDAVVAEVNQGGGGIAETIELAAQAIGSAELGRELIVPVRSVWARESKRARAEPVGALYERGRVHHVGHLPKLEKEMTKWFPGEPSPNRMDALVHGVTHLLLGGHGVGPLETYLS